MDPVFEIVLAWLCLTSMAVYTQTKSYGHLMICLGAVFTIATSLLLNNPTYGWPVLIVGRILFFGGFAILATFERDREVTRLRTSSWSEVLLGRVPEHLQTFKISQAAQVVQCLIISLLFALVFYSTDKKQEALSFFVIAAVYVTYLVKLNVIRRR